jgi:hypothetical protein
VKTMGVRQAAESAADRPGAPPRLPAEALRLDRLIRARAIHSMTGETYRCVGLRGAGDRGGVGRAGRAG